MGQLRPVAETVTMVTCKAVSSLTWGSSATSSITELRRSLYNSTTIVNPNYGATRTYHGTTIVNPNYCATRTYHGTIIVNPNYGATWSL